MPKLTDELATRYEQLIERWSAEKRTEPRAVRRERVQKLRRLKKQGTHTVTDLLKRLPSLSLNLKQFGIQLIMLLKIKQSIPILLNLMSDPKVRVSCAAAFQSLKSDKNVTRRFLTIGHRELEATIPDVLWLDAVIYGLGHSDDSRAAELLVTIFERTDLPGWLRGNAADKLGCCDFVGDRRTRLFRRCQTAALQGLNDKSIDVQFWSMYVIGSLCSEGKSRRSTLTGFESAIPKLQEFASHDHRFSPGYWWPMSAEAEDVVACIQNGCWPTKDAAERWQGKSARGKR
jgi:hypothetical protein